MKNVKKVLIVCLLFTSGFAVFAAETISLEQARALALLNSRSLARYNLAVQSNTLSERLHRYSNMPSFSLGASASASLWARDGAPQGVTAQDIAADSLSGSISLGVSQRLWNGGRSAILNAINSMNTEISRQDALAEFYAVLNSTDILFYAVLEAAAALETAESSLATAALSLEMAEIRRESGMISPAAYLQALAEKAARETARNQSRRDLAVANLRLADLLGLAYTPRLEPVDFDEREGLIVLLSASDDDALSRLYTVLWSQIQSRNPSMTRAALNSLRSERNVGLARRDYSPTLSASLGTGFSHTIDNGFTHSGGRLSLSANFPVDVWVTAANVQRQRIASEQAAIDYQSAMISLDIELRTLILDLVSNAGLIQSSRRALDYAESHFDLVLELYRLAGNSPSDLSDAETLVRNSRGQLSRSQFAFLTGLSRIRSLGVFDSDEEIIALIFSVFE
ncbi:MAG: TolC family protein [Treponema sp.]|nr:TolC family protein [Treponema sp.]